MLRYLLSRASLLLLAALLLPLAACDSGGSNDEEEPDVEDGRVNVSVDGEASGSFDGFAYFYEYTDPNTDETFFGLVLTSVDTETPNTTGEFITIVRQSSRPGAGTYSFANADDDLDTDDLQSDLFVAIISSATADQDVFGFYISDGGSLTIDQSSADAVSGRFEINATGFTFSSGSQQAEEVNITVEGAFNANPSSSPFFGPFGGGMTN
jgi:hypothetical protein